MTSLFAAGATALLLLSPHGAKTEHWSFTMHFAEAQDGFQVSVDWPATALVVDRSAHTVTIAGSVPKGRIRATTGTCVGFDGSIHVAAGDFPYRVTGKVAASGFTIDVHSVATIRASSPTPRCNDDVHETAEVLDPTLRTIDLPVAVAAGATAAHFSAGPVTVDLRRTS